jgi:cell division transport system permease protein
MRRPAASPSSLPWARVVPADAPAARSAITSRDLALVFGVMTLLLNLAIAGWLQAGVLVREWVGDIGATVTIVVPRPDDPAPAGAVKRRDLAREALEAVPGVASIHVLSNEEVADLLRATPGADTATTVPAIIEIRLAGNGDPSGIADTLTKSVPGASIERDTAWTASLAATAGGIRRAAGLVVLGVAVAAFTVTGLAIRSALLAAGEAMRISHQLGASDGHVAHRFANRAAGLAAVGAAIGASIALTAVAALAVSLATPGGHPVRLATLSELFSLLASPLWFTPVALSVGAWMFGYVTAQVAIRLWLRRLPGSGSA